MSFTLTKNNEGKKTMIIDFMLKIILFGIHDTGII